MDGFQRIVFFLYSPDFAYDAAFGHRELFLHCSCVLYFYQPHNCSAMPTWAQFISRKSREILLRLVCLDMDSSSSDNPAPSSGVPGIFTVGSKKSARVVVCLLCNARKRARDAKYLLFFML